METDGRSFLVRLEQAYDARDGQMPNVQRWMAENYDGFSETLRKMFPNGRVDWVWLTQWFQENGFRNTDGSDLKKETVRKSWIRVVETKSKVSGE